MPPTNILLHVPMEMSGPVELLHNTVLRLLWVFLSIRWLNPTLTAHRSSSHLWRIRSVNEAEWCKHSFFFCTTQQIPSQMRAWPTDRTVSMNLKCEVCHLCLLDRHFRAKRAEMHWYVNIISKVTSENKSDNLCTGAGFKNMAHFMGREKITYFECYPFHISNIFMYCKIRCIRSCIML